MFIIYIARILFVIGVSLLVYVGYKSYQEKRNFLQEATKELIRNNNKIPIIKNPKIKITINIKDWQFTMLFSIIVILVLVLLTR